MTGEHSTVEVLPWWLAAALFFMAAVGFLVHFSFRGRGRLAVKWVEAYYFNESFSRRSRVLPLRALAVAMVFTPWGVAIILTHFADNHFLENLMYVLTVAPMVPFCLDMKRYIFGYPDRIKPQWLLDEEQKRNASVR